MSGDGNVTVILTRPAGQNERLAQRLAAEGYRTIERPLLEIAPLEPGNNERKLMMELDRFDDIIFVSGNAVDHGVPLLEQYWPQWPIALHWAAVGPATAARLPPEITVTFPQAGASEALLQMERFREVSGRNVMIVRGRAGRELLADTLRERGAQVQYLEVYERKPVDHQSQDLPGETNVAVITSGEALERFADLVDARTFNGGLIVPSARVRTMAIERGFAKVDTVDNLNDESIVRAISNMV